MAKTKLRPGGGARKAPGVRKPRKPPKVRIPDGPHCKWPPKCDETHEDGGLTFRQEKFIEHFIDMDGNACRAYMKTFDVTDRFSAKVLACRMMKRQEIIDAIEDRRAEIRDALGITREKLLRPLVGIVEATIDDFSSVVRWGSNRDNFRGLGDKKHAVKSISIGEFGNSVQLHDKQAAINELWKKLGFEKAADTGSERDVTNSLLERVRAINGSGEIK